jgi:hypothetical protein
MTKITPDHLARGAFVYVRQSTAMQVAHNLESQRRQYGLADRARQLGWQDVEVIDDDLGRSGGGARRPGFERLLAAICEGRVGAVMSVEASRLARNGRDWHTLLEFCGLVGTVIIDEDGVYDPALIPASPNAPRIRLSDKTSRLHPRRAEPTPGQTYEPEVPVEVREWIRPASASPDLVFGPQPPAQPRRCVGRLSPTLLCGKMAASFDHRLRRLLDSKTCTRPSQHPDVFEFPSC